MRLSGTALEYVQIKNKINIVNVNTTPLLIFPYCGLQRNVWPNLLHKLSRDL